MATAGSSREPVVGDADPAAQQDIRLPWQLLVLVGVALGLVTVTVALLW